MKMKSGLYGIYHGKEYRVGRLRDGSYEIVDDYPEKTMPEGFTEYKKIDKSLIYFKQIQKEDLEEVYRITTYAVYKGKKRGIAAGNDKFVSLGGSADDMKYGFINVGRNEFRKDNIPTCDVDEFVEEKEPYDIKLL